MDTTMVNPQLSFATVVEEFLNLLLEEAGMGDTSPEVKAEMLMSLRERLNERLFATAILNLSEEQVTELRKIMENDAAHEQIETFLDTNIENAQEVFAGAFLTFRNDYLGLS